MTMNDVARNATWDMYGIQSYMCANEKFFFLLRWLIMVAVCVYGVSGNFIAFQVLYWKAKNNFAAHQLKILAIVDCVFLLMVALEWTLPVMFIISGRAGQLVVLKRFFTILVWPLVRAAQLGSNWMAAIIAANRYIVVCKPLDVAQYCSKKITRLELAALGVFVVLFSIPSTIFNYYFAETTLLDATSETDDDQSTRSMHEVMTNDAVFHPVYRLIYYDVLAYFIFVYLIPVSLIINFNVRMLAEIKRAEEFHHQMVPGIDADAKNVKRSFKSIICTSVVCQTPAMLNGFLNYFITGGQPSSCSYYGLFGFISKLLVSINSAMNFVNYYIIRRQFRREFYQVFLSFPSEEEDLNPENVIQQREAIEHLIEMQEFLAF